MFKKLLLTTAIVLATSAPGFAANQLTIQQLGATGDVATVSQTGGSDNDSDSDKNIGTIIQVDSYNTAVLKQSGVENTAYMYQSNTSGLSGLAEYANVSQTPGNGYEESKATVYQIGQGDKAYVSQGVNSDYNTANIYQGLYGASYQNYASISQGNNSGGASYSNTANIFQGDGGSSSGGKAFVKQDGWYGQANIYQYNGATNEYASINQGLNSYNEIAYIYQTGVGDLGYITQNGQNDQAVLTQSGSGNYASLVQDVGSNGSTANVSQVGQANKTSLYQNGALDVANIAQNGNGNVASVSQLGPSDTISLTQTGNGHIANVVQN